MILRNAAATGLVIFITGVIGYLIGGVVFGALVALIPTALPKLRILPTTIPVGMLRVFVIGLVLGLASIYSNPSQYLSGSDSAQASSKSSGSIASVAHPTAPPTSRLGGDPQKAACFDAYAQGKYQDALAGCKSLAFVYVPRLRELRSTKDEHVVLNDAYDLLKVTYTMSLAYGKVQDTENARQSALHCIGWGLFVVAAVDSINPDHSNVNYVAMRSEAMNDMKVLDTLYPGTLQEERKAFAETTSH